MHQYTKQVYEEFNKIRGYNKDKIPFKFWDVVVLTASDIHQKNSYESQLNIKVTNSEIPSGIDYLVFDDPFGIKIGSGGATMYVISELKKIYNSSLDNLYILIIHSGGYSQRLPSSSALGKIFMTLPYSNPAWQLLELKLASYIPFLKRMRPGIFITSSDTIELFYLDEEAKFIDWNFSKRGLTSLAHPSSIEIGKAHGVFVINDYSKDIIRESNSSQFFVGCLEVLQKPTIEKMKSKNAIQVANFKNNNLAEIDDEYVYTDSCFYFDQEFTQKLLIIYEKIKPLTCEIDCYGDFMQCLGQNANLAFASNYKNISKVTESLETTRTFLFNCLKGTPINVLALQESQFFHLGTLPEYLDNFKSDGKLGKLLGLQNETFSVYNNNSKSQKSSYCIIHSYINENSIIKSPSIVEFCNFSSKVNIESSCIVSNCVHHSNKSINDENCITLPSNTFVYTIPIKIENDNSSTNKSIDIINTKCKYTTIIFDINEDVKKETPIHDIKYFNVPLKYIFKTIDINMDNNFSNLAEKQPNHVNEISLWDVKLFPVNINPSDSLIESLKLVSLFKSYDVTTFPQPCINNIEERISAREAMKFKNILEILKYRQDLKLNIFNGLE